MPARKRRATGKYQVCSKCKLELDLKHFNRDARNMKRNGGYRYDCQLCQTKSQLRSLVKKEFKLEKIYDQTVRAGHRDNKPGQESE